MSRSAPTGWATGSATRALSPTATARERSRRWEWASAPPASARGCGCGARRAGGPSARPLSTSPCRANRPSPPRRGRLRGGACLGIPARTAHRCVFADGSVSGKVVLVAGGAGAVGAFAVSFAKWGGAEVVATVGSEVQAEAALEAGADHALNYRTDDVSAHVAEIAGASGVSRIVKVAFGRNLALDA